MKSYLLILFLVLSVFTNAQSWNALNYNPNQPDLELNPLKGFATLYGTNNIFPYSIQGTLFGLDQVMMGLDSFDWTAIDTFLLNNADKGLYSYIQVNIDPAKDSLSYLPSFLDSLVDVQFYDEGNGVAGYCPNYNDQDLIDAMLNFIAAFGAKYNADDRVFLVHLGLYGMWGEWHVNAIEASRPEFELTDVNKALIANAYSAAFPDNNLLGRYPENIPDPQTVGYSDGLFFGQSISPTNSFYFHNILKASNADQNWKLHPIGGELDPDLQDSIWKAWPNVVGQDVVACFDSIRPTWLFAHHNFSVLQSGTAEWDNAIRAQKLMGYTFHVSQSRFSAANGNPAVEVTIQNKGLAPMYANWDVELGLLNSSNQFQSLGSTKWNLNLIQPGSVDNYRSFVSDTTVLDDTYIVLLRVINPLESISSRAAPVRFANSNQDIDRTGWITLGQTTISGGSAGVIPTPVASLSVTPAVATVQTNNQLQLSALVLPDTATNKSLTWVSDHPMTASVDTNGLVTANTSYGTVIISAYTQDGNLVDTCVLTVEPMRVLLPAFIEAEDYIDMLGVKTQPCDEGGFNLSYIDPNDWMEYGVIVNTPTTFLVDFRTASLDTLSEISIVNENGDTLDKIVVPKTAWWQDFTTKTSNPVTLPAGAYNIRFVANVARFNLNWIEFRIDPTLPIELVDFKAITRKEHITLEWTTSFEENNEGFHLERSTNGENFSIISWIDGNDSFDGLRQYSFKDKNVEKNIDYYYRLIQQDTDGTYTYSEIRTAKLTGKTNSLIKVYPNPTTGLITIEGNNKPFSITPDNIKVLSVLGVRIIPTIINNNTIDLSNLPSGIYFIEIAINGEQESIRIIKKN